MLAQHILTIVFPIFAIVAVGLWYGRRYRPDLAVANRLIIDVFIPCLMFSVLSQQSALEFDHLLLALGVAVIILASGLLSWPLARTLQVDARTLCPPMMFSNAGNMGLPLIVLAFGEEALPAAVVIFLVENTLHFYVGRWILDNKPRFLRVLLTPSVLASLLGLACGLSVNIPEAVRLPVDMLGQICVPLMLFALGVRLADVDLADWRLGLTGALLSPLLGISIALCLIQLLDLAALQQGALFLFGALPPAVLNFMFAEHYRQEPAKVASIVLQGNALAVITIPLALAIALPWFAPAGAPIN